MKRDAVGAGLDAGASDARRQTRGRPADRPVGIGWGGSARPPHPALLSLPTPSSRSAGPEHEHLQYRLCERIDCGDDPVGVEILSMSSLPCDRQPLLVVVHPGELVAAASTPDEAADAALSCPLTSLGSSLARQREVGQAIERRLSTHHAVVVHCRSTARLRHRLNPQHGAAAAATPSSVVDLYARAVISASMSGDCLYGDDLVAVAMWIAKRHRLDAGRAVWVSSVGAHIASLVSELLRLVPALNVTVNGAEA